jgi:hypothetical protein
LGNNDATKAIEEKVITSFHENNLEDIIYIIKKQYLKKLDSVKIRELFDETTINTLLNPTSRNSFKCLKYLPDYVLSSETCFNYLEEVLSGKYFVYKTQAAVQLINHFFDRGYETIKRIVKQYKSKIRLPVLKALVNRDNEKADELAKPFDFSRYWYGRIFLKMGEKRITAERAHKILLDNNFKVVKERQSFTIFEFSSYSAFHHLSEKIDNLNQNEIIDFNTIERAFIRDAHIIIPALPLFDIDLGPYKKFRITLYHTIYSISLYLNTNPNYRGGYYCSRTGSSKNLAEILEKKKALSEEALRNKPNLMQEFYSEFSEFKKRLVKYYHDCKILKRAIKAYLSSTPELSAINDLQIEHKEKDVEDYRKVYPSTFKPSYNEENNALILYEAHKWGKYHADSHIRIHESGVVMVFVNTFVNYSKRHNYHNAQLYFFFPKLKRFYTRKANLVKDFKDVSNWDISITNLFGYDYLKTNREAIEKTEFDDSILYGEIES